jgi:hypothetical protein
VLSTAKELHGNPTVLQPQQLLGTVPHTIKGFDSILRNAIIEVAKDQLPGNLLLNHDEPPSKEETKLQDPDV